MIQSQTIPATQVVPGAPWQIQAAVLESSAVKQAAMDIKNRRHPRLQFRDESTLELAGLLSLKERGEAQEN